MDHRWERNRVAVRDIGTRRHSPGDRTARNGCPAVWTWSQGGPGACHTMTAPTITTAPATKQRSLLDADGVICTGQRSNDTGRFPGPAVTSVRSFDDGRGTSACEPSVGGS